MGLVGPRLLGFFAECLEAHHPEHGYSGYGSGGLVIPRQRPVDSTGAVSERYFASRHVRRRSWFRISHEERHVPFVFRLHFCKLHLADGMEKAGFPRTGGAGCVRRGESSLCHGGFTNEGLRYLRGDRENSLL